MGLRFAIWLPVVSLALVARATDGVPAANCDVEISLVDGETHEPLPGIVQLIDGNGEGIDVAELINRGQGLEQPGPIHQWWVLPAATTIRVPQAPLVVKGLSGLETELSTRSIDLTGKSQARLEVPLARFYRAKRSGRLAGNTHLHLMKLSKVQADRYLRQVPLADGLDIVFISYLERANADLDYTSNKYSPHDLRRLSHGHVHFGHGQEHRHNFGTHGEGYGHILLLDIPYVIQPVSIGPGIMGAGNDAPPLQAGIDEARRAGGKVIWAHNLFGLEDIPNWITGRVHANNIFDGSAKGSYNDSYYRYLNIGLSVPFSTGTDWFIYDFSRVYVTSDRAVTPTGWLELLAAGKTFITNGPLLDFSVDSQPVGSTIELSGARKVNVRGRAVGRLDFKQIEIIQNGRVVKTAPGRAEGGHFVATIDQPIAIDAPAWLAMRTVPPAVPEDPQLQETSGENEFGGRLFSHTSPIYIHVDGKGVFDRDTAAGLVREMRLAVEKIEAQAHFADDAQRRQVLSVYNEAIEVVEKRMKQ